MESEKNKQSTSAAVSTLGVAAMLSAVNAVSQAFSGPSARSVVTDTEDEGSDASPSIWNEENLRNSQVRSPKKMDSTKPRVEPLFGYRQDGAWRDEIEVEIQTKNKKRFTGTITPTEAKHQIYIDALGFENHNNFDGVRINFKGKLIVTFKLIEPINIDDLDAIEHFDFNRTSTVNGKKFVDVIGCRIRGIRYRPLMVSSLDSAPKDDGKKLVKIEGCEYRVTEDEILQWLSNYGEVTSKLEEDVFRDEVAKDGIGDGTNRTGNYSIMMKLDRPIPQLLPMCGRRVKIYHAGIQKLCTNCFGPHKKSTCTNVKVAWINYVQTFIEENDEIKPEMYGKWIDIVQRVREEATNQHNPQPNQTQQQQDSKTSTTSEDVEILTEVKERESQIIATNEQPLEEKCPTEEDFNIPTTKEAYETMMDMFKTVGLSQSEADEAIKARTLSFNRACREFRKKQTEKKKQAGGRVYSQARRNSLKKQ